MHEIDGLWRPSDSREMQCLDEWGGKQRTPLLFFFFFLADTVRVVKSFVVTVYHEWSCMQDTLKLYSVRS